MGQFDSFKPKGAKGKRLFSSFLPKDSEGMFSSFLPKNTVKLDGNLNQNINYNLKKWDIKYRGIYIDNLLSIVNEFHEREKGGVNYKALIDLIKKYKFNNLILLDSDKIFDEFTLDIPNSNLMPDIGIISFGDLVFSLRNFIEQLRLDIANINIILAFPNNIEYYQKAIVYNYNYSKIKNFTQVLYNGIYQHYPFWIDPYNPNFSYVYSGYQQQIIDGLGRVNITDAMFPNEQSNNLWSTIDPVAQVDNPTILLRLALFHEWSVTNIYGKKLINDLSSIIPMTMDYYMGVFSPDILINRNILVQDENYFRLSLFQALAIVNNSDRIFYNSYAKHYTLGFMQKNYRIKFLALASYILDKQFDIIVTFSCQPNYIVLSQDTNLEFSYISFNQAFKTWQNNDDVDLGYYIYPIEKIYKQKLNVIGYQWYANSFFPKI